MQNSIRLSFSGDRVVGSVFVSDGLVFLVDSEAMTFGLKMIIVSDVSFSGKHAKTTKTIVFICACQRRFFSYEEVCIPRAPRCKTGSRKREPCTCTIACMRGDMLVRASLKACVHSRAKTHTYATACTHSMISCPARGSMWRVEKQLCLTSL